VPVTVDLCHDPVLPQREAATDATPAVLLHGAGYAAIRLVPAPTTLAWYTAAALLVERVLAAVHGLRSEGLLHLDALLADAITLVN